jgi:hypothetical protein
MTRQPFRGQFIKTGLELWLAKRKRKPMMRA